MARIAKHVTFKGRVQGVGFRFTALSVANQYKLSGYVRNLPNGTVEMLAQGNPENIDACIDDISANYPSNITEVNVEETSVDPDRKVFKITF